MRSPKVFRGLNVMNRSTCSKKEDMFFVNMDPESAVASTNGNCSYSSCTTNMDYRDPIRFPFRTPDQPLSCGLPGFDLSCNNFNRTPILLFPYGHFFNVLSISNSSQYITISDPQRCLPEKLMHFNSSGTPFYFKRFTKFRVYSCPLSFEMSHNYYFWCQEVDCLRGQKRSIVCTNEATSYSSLHNECEFIGDTNVAGSWSSYSFSIADSADLSWDVPDQCRRCELKNQDCLRDPDNFTLIKCFRRPSSQINAGVVMLVSAAISLPIIFGVVYKCYIHRISSQGSIHGVRVSSNVVDATTDQNHVETRRSTNRGGLEQATLDAYPVIVVGDSGRILMCMEDKVCPICLSEYEPRDTIKSLPKCLHRFHSDCIDEWLHKKAICPVCRTMPPQISL